MNQSTRPTEKWECLDGLRGIAIILVILFHLHEHRQREFDPSVDAVLRNFWFGTSGVNLFLVLSGFCLGHSLIQRDHKDRSPSLRSFFLARFRRIAPPYYVSALLYLGGPLARLALLGEISPLLSARQIGSHVAFLHGFADDTMFAYCAAYWSLSLEVQFYLVLPLLYASACRWGWGWVVAVVAAGSLAWNAWAEHVAPGSLSLSSGVFVGRLTEFAMGMGLAFAIDRQGLEASRRVAWTAAALAGALLLGSVWCYAPRFSGYRVNFVLGAGFTLLLLAGVLSARRRGWLGRLLELRALTCTGEISYSLYLTHVFSQGKAFKYFDRFFASPTVGTDLAMIAIGLVAIWGVGWVFHHLVERRFIRAVDARRKPAVIEARTRPVVDCNA